MAKPANKSRGEVAVPEAGDGAFFRFGIDALERLEAEYGEDYFDVVLQGLSKGRISILKTCLAVALVDGDADALLAKVPSEVSTDTLKTRLYDAVFVTVYGMTFDEKQKDDEKRLLEQIEEAKSDPKKAAILSYKLSAEQGIEQDFDPEKSAA